MMIATGGLVFRVPEAGFPELVKTDLGKEYLGKFEELVHKSVEQIKAQFDPIHPEEIERRLIVQSRNDEFVQAHLNLYEFFWHETIKSMTPEEINTAFLTSFELEGIEHKLHPINETVYDLDNRVIIYCAGCVENTNKAVVEFDRIRAEGGVPEFADPLEMLIRSLIDQIETDEGSPMDFDQLSDDVAARLALEQMDPNKMPRA